MVESFVGWPIDMVARKLVQQPVLVGREALDNRSMLDLRRPLERGVIREGSEKDAEAVRELLRHLMSLVGLKQKSKSRPKVRAVVGVPAEAFRVSKQHLRTAMEGLADGVMSVVVLPEPLGPRSVTNSPLPTSRSMASTAVVPG